jgi:hypothetical protein
MRLIHSYKDFSAFSIILVFLAACSPIAANSTLPMNTSTPAVSETPLQILPASTVQPVSQVVDSNPPALWISPALPSALAGSINILNPVTKAPSAAGSDLQFVPISPREKENAAVTTRWLYALVTPFPTLTDYVSMDDIQKAWRGEKTVTFTGRPLLLSPETEAVFTEIWGQPAEKGVKVLPAKTLLEAAWQAQPAWALVPFEELEPRWKVMAVDGLSPLDKSLDPEKYALTARLGFTGSQVLLSEILQNQKQWVDVPATNRDPDKMTTLVMTGTTALTRGTAERMEVMGVHYPAEKILSWLRDADLTHISNEIPFSKECPPAVPVRTDWNFCSSPAYLDLLDYIGADIIELTGNHVMDWGAGDLLYTLQTYAENHYRVYGGGKDRTDAQKALLVEDHGNKLAFIGCTPPGPAYAWATDESPGNAPCDRDWMASEVRRLSDLGYQVIVTFQHMEVYDYAPVPPQRGDFQFMAEAGAAIVSGSQSHFPQGMGFYNGSFLHYGLGNLFFDQMDEPVIGTRREFLDRHIFYNGKYISTELLTAMLEDHAQPRPMTSNERKALLRDAFNASTWWMEK